MSRDAYRYYAYSPEMGRRRIPNPDTMAMAGTTIPLTEEMAIEWAAGRGALNVVREDGPASKPTAITMIWNRQADFPRVSVRVSASYDLHMEIYNELANRFPNATVADVARAAKAIEAIISKE